VPPEADQLEADLVDADQGAGRREFAVALLAGAAGAGLILLALRQVWAHARYTPPHPFPATDLAISGQRLVPLVSALAIAALACLAAVIATRGVLRRAAGVLLAAIGIGAAIAATATVTSAAVLSAAVSAGPTAGNFSGSTTSGTTSGGTGSTSTIIGTSSGHAVITGLPWHVAAVAGSLAIVLTGLATAWRGTRWPVMSARFDRPGREGPGQRGEQRAADSATMWESLSRDVDPTDLPAGPADPADPTDPTVPADAPDEVDFGSGGR
jgi:uncharacterized membrane protein (TIGR02234 family)